MITMFLKSSSTALDYNEKKLFTGKADIVEVRNIKDKAMFNIRKALKELEDNPAIHAAVRNTQFHLTVNPGPDDDMDEGKVLAYIHNLMDDLGLGGQPYVVFRHKDIERAHYHIVCSRVLEDGTVISDSFIGLKTQHIQEDLAKKYGFTVGRPDRKDVVPMPAPIRRGMKNLIEQIRADVNWAISYRHDNDREEQLSAILIAYGIKMTRDTKMGRDGVPHPYVSFCAVDGRGKPLMRPVQARKLLGEPFDSYYAKHYKKRKNPIPDSVEKVQHCYEECDGLNKFRKRLNKLGVSSTLYFNPQSKDRSAADITDMLFVYPSRCDCLTLADCNLQLKDIIHLAMMDEERKKKEGVATKTNKINKMEQYTHNKKSK